MITNDKITSFVVKLNKETVNKTIKWHYSTEEKYKDEGTDDIIPLMYIYTKNGKNLAIYERKSRHWIDDVDYVWNNDVHLAILASDGTIIWDTRHPPQALRDLFETVRRQSSGIEEILDEFLSNP